MKTTIYELLGMIKDGKAPKKIKYKGSIFEWGEVQADYYSIEANEWLFDEYVLSFILNDEVEILDESKEDKIKKLSILTFGDFLDMEKGDLVDVIKEQRFKINEIIDRLNNI